MKFGLSHRGSYSFNQVPTANIQRSAFNLSHTYKTAFDSGYLVPFFKQVAYPGDTFAINANCFARLSTPIVPFMDNLYLDIFWFGVPWRLVWTNFQKFCGEQANPGDSTSYLIPQATSPANGYAVGSLQDYFGLPTVGQVGTGKTVTHNNLFLRAYNLIWNEWFRDENMQNSVTVDKGDGPDTYSNYVTLRRGKRFDYFTSCLPWPQKGTAVSIPLGNTAPVGNLGTNSNISAKSMYGTNDWYTVLSGGGTTGSTIAFNPTYNPGNWQLNYSGANQDGPEGNITTVKSTAAGVLTDQAGTAIGLGVPFGWLTADLTQATSTTVNQLRQAIQVQGLYERDARGGTRYTEIVMSHFKVRSPDARLQRPEVLSTHSAPIKVNPVVQTGGTGASGTSTPQGNLAAYGVCNTGPNGFTKSFTEHMLIIGLASVRAELTYQQGLDREWTDQTKLDLYWPALAHLGEQAVYTKEIYCTGDATNDQTVFGYQERYAHLRCKNSQITGILRSTAATPLDVWHLAQKFTAAPTLGDTFIKETPPISRVVAVNTEPQFIFDSYIQFKAVRPLPTYSVPGVLMRF